MRYHLKMLRNHEKGCKLTGLILFSALILYLSCGIVIAQEVKQVPSDSICFSPVDSYSIVSTLDKADSLERINIQLEKQTLELTKQVELYKENVKLAEDKVKAAEDLAKVQENSYKLAALEQENLYQMKEKALKDDLEKASKPRWSSLFGAAGLGAAITALLIILL